MENCLDFRDLFAIQNCFVGGKLLIKQVYGDFGSPNLRIFLTVSLLSLERLVDYANGADLLQPQMAIREDFSHPTFFSGIKSLLPDYIMQHVNSFKHHFNAHSDILVWTPNPSGSYSFKSAYGETKPKRITDNFSKHIWSTNIPSKISFFI